MNRQQPATVSFQSLVKQIWKLSFALALVLMITASANAQGGVDEDPDEGVPIDGGISLLVAAGIGYGAKKVHEARKKKEQEQLEK